MTRKLAFALAALALTLAVGVTAAFAGTSRTGADPGVTSTSILLGATSPLSGTASAYASVARGANAYFEHVNARGGVNGRKIAYEIVTTRTTPAQTVQATRKLVEQDSVFAIFNALGTEHNLAVRDYLNAQKVPQLFAASGVDRLRHRGRASIRTRSASSPATRRRAGCYGKYLARTRGRGEGRGAVPERRLRQGPPERPEEGPPAVEASRSSRRSPTRCRRATSRLRSRSCGVRRGHRSRFSR